ncbi:MAG: Arc family DNA-binding protein [Ideonella sp.]|nr:Arc family DNA-binding protein [Ideonella sp.]
MNLSIKDVPDHIAERLRARAARNHRSLQGELMAIVEQAAAEAAATAAAHPLTPVAADIHPLTGRRYRVLGRKTIEQLMVEREAAGWKPDPSLARAPLAVDIVRAARESR